MVDRVRKGKINAGGSRRTPRKFDFLATPDVSIRSFLFFFFFFTSSFFPNRQETITDEGEWNVDGEIGKEGGARRISRFLDSSNDRTRTTASSRWIYRLKRRRQLGAPIVNRFDRYWNGGRLEWFSQWLLFAAVIANIDRDSSLRVKRERDKELEKWKIELRRITCYRFKFD